MRLIDTSSLCPAPTPGPAPGPAPVDTRLDSTQARLHPVPRQDSQRGQVQYSQHPSRSPLHRSMATMWSSRSQGAQQQHQLQILPSTDSYQSMLIMPGDSPITNYNISQILSEIVILTASNNNVRFLLRLQLNNDEFTEYIREPTSIDTINYLRTLSLQIAPTEDMRNLTRIHRDGNTGPFIMQDGNTTTLLHLLSGALNLLGRIRDVLGHNQNGWAQIRREIGVESNEPFEGGSIKSNTKQKTRRNHRKGNYNSRKRYN